MPDRITLNAINNTFLADSQRTIAHMATYQEQLATGKRVNRVSDDPVAARQAMRYRAESLQTDKWISNISKGSVFVQASDEALGQMSELLGMLLIPWFFRRLGVRYMLAVGMAAWVIRYAFFAYGDAGAELARRTL